jgi:hypothetical protein
MAEAFLTQQRQMIDMMTQPIEQLEVQNPPQQTSMSVPPPKPLDLSGDKVENLRQFRHVWTNYSIACGLEYT